MSSNTHSLGTPSRTFGRHIFRDLSLRTKLISAFVIVAVLSVGAVTLIGDRTIRTSLTQSVSANLKVLAQNKATVIGNLIDRQVDLLSSLALNKSVQDELERANSLYSGSPWQIRGQLQKLDLQWTVVDDDDPLVQQVLNNNVAEELREFRAAFPDNVEVLLTDQQGAAVGATNRVAKYYNGAEAWWQVAYNNGQGQVYVGVPEFNRKVAGFGIVIAVPVRLHQSDRAMGVLRSIYRIEAFEEVLRSAHFGETGVTDLLLPNQQFLHSEGGVHNADPQELAILNANVNADAVDMFYEGKRNLVSQAPVVATERDPTAVLSDLGWRLVVAQEPSEALAPVNRAAQAMALTGLGALVLAVLLAIGVSQFLARPITRLTAVATQVSEGDLSVQAHVESRDEIGLLAQTFNHMTTQLRQTLESLEQRVRERTHQLEENQNELQASKNQVEEAYRTLQQNSGYLAALNEMTLGLMSRLDVDDLLSAIVTRAAALVGSEHGYLYLRNPGEPEMRLRVGAGMFKDLIGTRTQPGSGLAGKVWQSGETFVLEDYQTWPQHLTDAHFREIHAVIGVPLKSENEVVGVVGMAYTDPEQRFSKTEVEVFERFAQLANIALENARLFEQTEQRVAELGALNSISQIVSTERNIVKLIERVGDQLLAIFRVKDVCIAMVDNDAKQIEILYLVNNETHVSVPPLALGDGLPSLVVETREPLLLQENAPERVTELGTRFVGAPAKSYLAVPVLAADQVIGVISVQSNTQEGFFGENELRLLSTIAANVGVGIQNMQLFAQTQSALAEASRLAERERLAANELKALTRRLTGEGWQDFMQQHGEVRVEAARPNVSGGRSEIPELTRAAETSSLVVSKENGRSALALPIVVRGEVIGTIGLEDYDAKHEWSEDRIGIINDVVENLGLALDNARLYSESQRRVTELDALNRISQAITTELELDSLLKTVGDQVREIFDVQNIYIALYDKNTQRIALPYFINDSKPAQVEPIRFGEGITSEIIRTRRPLLMNERTDQKMAALGAKVYGNPARSYLGVPIFVGEEVTGVISIQSTSREGAFDDANVRLLETIAAAIGAAIQNAQLYGAMQQEVVVRQRAEEEIKLSLKEKEILLKEIHHRVKNNLQIITSLLNLQSAQIKDAEAATMFRESQARVRSMALIHEKLYQSKDLARIDFDGYVRDLMVYLFRSYAANPDQIRTEMDTSNLFLGIDTAIPCGLIISELVTNSMKYAFPDGRRGHIYIGLHPQEDGNLALRVADDGIGFKDDFDWRESDSLGLQLVSTLTAQLHGTIQVSGKEGTSFVLTFPG
ncbi:MAG: GAF domain-containing protein [Chloroflexi bacterium]|nr:GAF domain-containing protein [Chloroflexota bacterium]